MSRLIRRLSLSAVLAVPAPSSAQLVDQGVPAFLRAVFGANRLMDAPLDPGRVPAQVRVIDAEQIRASGARTLQELLERQPGVVLYDEIGNAFQSRVDLRGFNASPVPATVVMVDGARVNEPDFGQTNFQTIPLGHVERVEIVPGPSSVFGRGALAGVVNVVTKRASGPRARGELETAAGSWGRHRQRASFEGARGAFDAALHFSHEQEDGYRRAAGADVNLASGRFGWRGDGADLSLSYAWADDDLNQAGSLTAAELGRDRRQNVSFVRTEGLQHLLSLNGRRSLADGLSLAANVRYRRRLENTPLNRGRTSVSIARAETDSSGGALQLSVDRDPGGRRSVSVLGAEYGQDAVESDSSGSFGGSPFLNKNSTRDEAAALYAQQSLDLAGRLLVLSAGLRYDFSHIRYADHANAANDGSRRFDRLTKRAGLNWNPDESFGAFFSYSEGFRTPTANEISTLGPFSSGPLLRPVKARALELGSRARGGLGEAALSLFRTDVRDEIFPVFDPTAGFGQNRNLDRTRRQGVELDLRSAPGPVSAFAAWSYVESTFRSDFALDKAPFPATQRVEKGDVLPLVPRQRLSAGVSLRKGGWTASPQALCVGSRHVFGDESNVEPKLGSYCTLDAGLSFERGPVRVDLRGFNVLGRRYESRGILGTLNGGLERFLVPAPGASFFGGVRYRFGEG